ncbi:MAG: sodium/proline symporter [Woeseia sp.]|nr:sodium/proline symporter [Woeseia sp.]NNE62313.1 sodium/proline symporter [Woeseia sp.]NNL54793.1 sodium/proline symporter [Woeseia sp.]
MDRTDSVFLTLIVYNAVLIGVGLWARSRNKGVEDYFLAGRGLGPWVAAISASASSSSAWTLLGVSGAAYAWGLPALWIFPATVGGFMLNWLWVAPRLKELAQAERAVTLSEVVVPATLGPKRKQILRIAAAIIVFCFIFYIASQFEAAGKAFESVFELSKHASIMIGAAIVLAYTLLGGFWAVSVTDSIQGILMVVASVALPVVALSAVGGFGALLDGLHVMGAGGSPIGTGTLVGVFFVLGLFGIGLGYPGQPHVVNRFMALKDEQALHQGRVIAIGWAVVVYSGMLLLGLSARVLFADLGDSEQVLFHVATELLPALVSGVMVAAVLSAIMSTADSQLLVAASAISYDWNLTSRQEQHGLRRTRTTVVAVLILATVLALVWQADIFSRVLFAWSAAGSAFGPLLIMRLLGRSVSPAATRLAMLTGFGLTVFISLFPDTPGDVAERLVPFFVALAIAAAGQQKAQSA